MKIQIGSTLLGRFEVLDEVGHGSTGSVYRVWDRQFPARALAAKVVAGDDFEAGARLRAEFKVLAHLHHPNLIRAFDLISIANTPHHLLTLEYVSGMPFLAATSGLAIPEILELLAQVCDGLDYLHRRAVAHRDVKSENILIEPTDGKLRAVVADFGLAGSAHALFAADPAGTPGYFAPEILEGRPGDHRSDLYSFGILAFSALTGRQPESLSEARHSLRKLVPSLSPLLSATLERLLSRDPAHRPHRASEIASALRGPAATDRLQKIELVPASSAWPLAGRSTEFRSVVSSIDALGAWSGGSRNARGRAVLLIAESGLGRTRMLSEWLIAAQLAGLPVLTATSHLPSSAPFATVRELIQAVSYWMRVLAPGLQRAEVLQQRFDALARALEVSAESSTALQQAYAEDRPTWIQTEFNHVLTSLAEACPFVALVDDVHHIDQSSLTCLQHLAALAGNARFVLVLSARAPIDDASQAVMNSLRSSFSAQDVLTLQPLSIHETESLACSIFGRFPDAPAVAREIDRLAGGRPAFIDLVLNELRREGVLRPLIAAEPFDLAALRAVPVPDSINEWVVRQLDSLDRRARLILGAIAVLNRPILPANLHGVAMIPREEERGETIDECVDTLLAHGLLDFASGATRGAVIFPHSLLRDAVYQSLPPSDLRDLHARAAEYLLQLPEGTHQQLAGEICEHLVQASRPSDAARFALLAGESAWATWALEDAAHYFALVLECGPTAPSTERLTALQGLAQALNASAKYVEAVETLTTLLREATDLRRHDYVARALATLAESKVGLSDYVEAEDLAGRALRLARQLKDPSTQARALQAVGNTYHFQSRLEEARTAYAELSALREALPNEIERAIAAHNLGWVYNSMRSFDEAATHFHKAESIYRQLGNIPRLANSLSSIGANELDAGRFQSAVRHLEHGLLEAGQSNGRRTQGLCYANLGQARYRLGQFDEAVDCLLEAQRILSHSNNPRYVAFVEMTLGWVLADKGDIQQAEHFLSLAREKSLAIDDQPGLALSLAAQGTIHGRLGDSLAARFWFERGLELARASSDRQAAATCLIGLSMVSVEDSNTNLAIEQAGEARLLASEIGAADTEHLASLALAEALVNSSRFQESAPLIQACIERIETHGLAADLPRALLLRSVLLAREGRPAEAEKTIELARVHAAANGSVETRWTSKAFQTALRSARAGTKQAEQVENNLVGELHDFLLTITDEARRRSLLRRAAHRLASFEESIRSDLAGSRSVGAVTMRLPTTTGCALPVPGGRRAEELVRGVAAPRGAPRTPPALRSVLNLLLDRAVHATRAARGGVLLLENETGRLLPAVLRDLERESLVDATEMSNSVMEAALEGRTDVIGSDLLSDPAWTGKMTTRARQIPATLALPLLRGAGDAPTPADGSPRPEPQGVLYLDRQAPGEPFGPADRRVARRIAAEMVSVLEAWHRSSDTWHRLRDLDLASDLLDRIVLPEGEEEADRAATATFGDVTIIGSGPGMRRALELIARLAGSRTPVLIGGETGTGKELVARALHAAGSWSAGPFVALDCGALNESLAESELFGHARGAFTGAERDRPGLLRSAEGGTVFLDEIGNLAPPLQLKLLRALETNEVRPVGSDRSIPFRARLVAATNVDLPAAVEAGTFRADLFHRLQGGTIRLPPLRDHMEDLEPLTRLFLARIAASTGRSLPEVAPAVWGVLHRHDWPGNVRELRLTLEVTMAMNQGDVLEVVDLPARVTDAAATARSGQAASDSGASPAPSLPQTMEGRMILQALLDSRWDKAAAARRIGWSRQKLYRAMTNYELPLRASGQEQDVLRRNLAREDRATQARPGIS